MPAIKLLQPVFTKLFILQLQTCVCTLQIKTLLMEPEVVAFLKRVALSIFLTFCWLALNVTIGLHFDLAFAEGSVSPGNILFYIWMSASFIALLIYLIKLWRKAEKW